jgi:hypothetical protein
VGGDFSDVCVVGDAIVAGESDGILSLIDPETGDVRATLRDNARYEVRLCALDRDRVAVLGRTRAGGSAIEVWSLASASQLGRVEIEEAESVAASADGARVYAGTRSGKIVVIATPAGGGK